MFVTVAIGHTEMPDKEYIRKKLPSMSGTYPPPWHILQSQPAQSSAGPNAISTPNPSSSALLRLPHVFQYPGMKRQGPEKDDSSLNVGSAPDGELLNSFEQSLDMIGKGGKASSDQHATRSSDSEGCVAAEKPGNGDDDNDGDFVPDNTPTKDYSNGRAAAKAGHHAKQSKKG